MTGSSWPRKGCRAPRVRRAAPFRSSSGRPPYGCAYVTLRLLGLGSRRFALAPRLDSSRHDTARGPESRPGAPENREPRGVA